MTFLDLNLTLTNILVASWFLSPVLAGILSVTLFWILHVKVLIPSQGWFEIFGMFYS